MDRRRGRRTAAGRAEPRGKSRYVRLVAEAGNLFVAPKPGDHGTPERANHAGGLIEGFRRDPDFPDSNRVIRGAQAAQPGQLEILIAAEVARCRAEGREQPEVSLLMRAAHEIRRRAEVAKLRRRVTGGYLMVVPGRDGIDPKAEAREEQAAKRLRLYCVQVGQIAFCAMIDLVVFDMAIGPLRAPHALRGLASVGAYLRHESTSKKGN